MGHRPPLVRTGCLHHLGELRPFGSDAEPDSFFSLMRMSGTSISSCRRWAINPNAVFARSEISTGLMPEDGELMIAWANGQRAPTLDLRFRLVAQTPQLKSLRVDRSFDHAARKVMGRRLARPDDARTRPGTMLRRELATCRIAREGSQILRRLGLENVDAHWPEPFWTCRASLAAINLSKPGELLPGHRTSFGLCQPADRGRAFGSTDRRDALVQRMRAHPEGQAAAGIRQVGARRPGGDAPRFAAASARG